jgi:hypothetical protein
MHGRPDFLNLRLPPGVPVGTRLISHMIERVIDNLTACGYPSSLQIPVAGSE